ncbi:ADP-heptose--LPS heptosyltransferase [Shewanella sp. UCD-FRSSP16_17]|uniref:glycosyltransferase family 9 protein n=1 Tax=Shewanella sp. UCD-FRSSP16_17 TaxID=1853256 RepID=UPI0007EED885|nr:glycosyltransferase family 9 protein [Shewanella sp. UCD-FRSSP16_17]OBT05539.1 ADP-heptose--LPS heptosyltransferase [Shewanella sp. UCD-FRSSP16_17]
MSIISPQQLINCNRLLIISPFALGDFLYFKTFLIALKQQHPHIEIDIWLDDNRCNNDAWRLSRSKTLQQWIQAEGCFGCCYGCTDSIKSRDAQLKEAQTKQYDIVICHSPGNKAKQFSDIARTISPKGYIVSSMTKVPYKGFLNKFLFRRTNAIYILDTKLLGNNHHITDRFYMVANAIFGLILPSDKKMPSLTIPLEITQLSQQWLKDNFPKNKSGKTILINHLSTSSKRDWKIEQVIDLINKLHTLDSSTKFIINVTKENFDKIQSILQVAFNDMPQPPETAVFTIHKHFFELPSIIAASDFVITVETAIMHFATASQTPLISLMRPKKSYWAPPTSASSKVLYAQEGKMHVSDISVETVYEQYLSMKK